jgi:hypothetical protein
LDRTGARSGGGWHTVVQAGVSQVVRTHAKRPDMVGQCDICNKIVTYLTLL